MKIVPLWVRVLPLNATIFLLLFWPVIQLAVIAEPQYELYGRSSIIGDVKPDTNSRHHGHPNRVVIPSIELDLTVIRGDYNQVTSDWDVSETDANFAYNSATPNSISGNTIIYGHDTDHVLRSTASLSHGDLVAIYTTTGDKFTYKYKSDDIVEPTDTSIFADVLSGKPRLTLITCSGWFSEKRRLMYFDLYKVSQ